MAGVLRLIFMDFLNLWVGLGWVGLVKILTLAYNKYLGLEIR